MKQHRNYRLFSCSRHFDSMPKSKASSANKYLSSRETLPYHPRHCTALNLTRYLVAGYICSCWLLSPNLITGELKGTLKNVYIPCTLKGVRYLHRKCKTTTSEYMSRRMIGSIQCCLALVGVESASPLLVSGGEVDIGARLGVDCQCAMADCC